MENNMNVEEIQNINENEEFLPNIILATGQDDLDYMLSMLTGYNILSTIQYKEHLFSTVVDVYDNVDILIVGDMLGGKERLFPILFQIKATKKDIRIIYITEKVNPNDEAKLSNIGALVSLGIYDIIDENIITPNKVQHVLREPQTLEDIEHLLVNIKDSSYGNKAKGITVRLPEKDTSKDDGTLKNLHVFMSSRSGVGKTTMLINTAIAISEMGVKNAENKQPRVGIIDLDFSEFTAGTLLGVNNEDNNIFTLMDESVNIITESGELINNTEDETRRIMGLIKDSFVSIPNYNNIKILTGPLKPFHISDIENVRQYFLMFLIQSVMKDANSYFDVILVDIDNDPLLTNSISSIILAESLIYIMDMDYNTSVTASRFYNRFNDLGINHKVNYVLNKSVRDNYISEGENLIYDKDKIEGLNFNFIADVPLINPVKMLNYNYTNTFPISDNSPDTLDFRYNVIKIANSIWDIKGFDKIQEHFENKDLSDIDNISNDMADISNVTEEKESFFESIGKKVKNIITPAKSNKEFNINSSDFNDKNNEDDKNDFNEYNINKNKDNSNDK